MSKVRIKENPIASWLFTDTRSAWLWLVIRIYIGYQWLDAGLHKFGSDAWTGNHAGTALAGFIKGALAKSSGDHPDVQGWYANFLHDIVLPNAPIFSWAVSLGEMAVGIALILGVLTGIAAFFGIVMNANYLLAGTLSTNPILIILGTLVVLGWRVAGYIGVDHFLIKAIGTPWQPTPWKPRVVTASGIVNGK